MITIEINERTKAGKTLLEVARLFSKDKKGVKIIEKSTASKKEYPVSKNIPNAETLKAFEETERGVGITKTKNHKDLLEKLYS